MFDDIVLVNETGFLPLFKNEIEGFSAEEHVSPLYRWTGDQEQDLWVWRELTAGTGEIAYGKFFGLKAGFISMERLPVFVNFRRDGYDFDARWDDELASIRHKGIMDCFGNSPGDGIAEYTGLQLKQLAGFGKGGHKNFDGIMRRKRTWKIGNVTGIVNSAETLIVCFKGCFVHFGKTHRRGYRI